MHKSNPAAKAVNTSKEETLVGSMDEKQLKTRWLETDPEASATRRDVMVDTLKTRCREDSSDRPLRMDLRGINLNQLDLSGLDLSGYDLSFAEMNRVNLKGANLSHAVLESTAMEKSVLDDCEFIGANLVRANLNECSARHSGFGGADLSHASLINSDLSQAVFSRSSLHSADLRAADLTGARLAESDLSHAVFNRATLVECDLKQSNVAHTRFDLADLRQCRLLSIKNFKTAVWLGADIRDMDLRGAYLVRRFISDENYLFEFKSQSRLHAMIYWIWWFTSDCGRSLLRWLVWLVVATLVYAGLYTLVSIDYGDYPTWYSPIYFSFVTLTTLGYGDAVPMTFTAQVIVTLQAVTGYMGLGGLLSILGNKMARRAE
ncbi:MAG: hypothetical protein D3926_01465 [Desulfobacteraceae bacterium]|nr:MAG: hypothetical protein D3926_01465 [Desulfobacteraceae bacterium]